MKISRVFVVGAVLLASFAAHQARAETGTCVLKNPHAFPYVTNVETNPDQPTIEGACLEVLACMNNPLCVRYGAPDYHFGWVLDSWYPAGSND